MVQAKTYWGIKHGKNIIFRGTFQECWEDFTKHYADMRVADLVSQNVRITRVA